MPTFKQISDNLYQISGAVNAYLIDSEEDGLILIDAGMPRWRDTVLGILNNLDKSTSDLNHVLITHADMDHVGSLGPIAQSSGAEVYASRESSEFIHQKKSPPHGTPLMKPFMWMATKLFVSTSFVHQLVEDNQLIDLAGGIRVIRTPGHTPDHISFYWEPEGVLFAGDLMANRNDILEFMPSIINWNMEQVKHSTKKVMELDPKLVCVGHGDVADLQADSRHRENIERLLA